MPVDASPELLAELRAKHPDLPPIRRRYDIGQGDPGRPRPDHGAGYSDLECTVCGATWVGLGGDECMWCIERAERRERWMDEDDAAARRERRRVRGRLRCDTCGGWHADGPLLERAVCGVHGGPTTCNGRLQAVYE